MLRSLVGAAAADGTTDYSWPRSALEEQPLPGQDSQTLSTGFDQQHVL